MKKSDTQISRVTRSKEEAKASYDRLSKWYDAFAGSEKPFAEVGLQKLGAKEGEAVLEIGFGTGHAILALARSVGDSGKVYGIDLSEGMLNIAHARIKEARLLARVALECGDAAKLPFEADFFDSIFMSFTLELFDTPEIPVVLRECRRVLKSGGRLCVVGMSKSGQAGWPVRLYEWFHAKWPAVVDCRPIFVREALEEAGFQIVEATRKTMWGLPVEIVLSLR